MGFTMKFEAKTPKLYIRFEFNWLTEYGSIWLRTKEIISSKKITSLQSKPRLKYSYTNSLKSLWNRNRYKRDWTPLVESEIFRVSECSARRQEQTKIFPSFKDWEAYGR